MQTVLGNNETDTIFSNIIQFGSTSYNLAGTSAIMSPNVQIINPYFAGNLSGPLRKSRTLLGTSQGNVEIRFFHIDQPDC